MLQINIFFIVVDINKDCVLLSALCQSCGPVCTRITRKITETIEVTPSKLTDIYENKDSRQLYERGS